jgi:hypothetical protein
VINTLNLFDLAGFESLGTTINGFDTRPLPNATKSILVDYTTDDLCGDDLTDSFQQFQIQGSYPKYPATKVAATQTKPAQGGLRLPNWRVMML